MQPRTTAFFLTIPTLLFIVSPIGCVMPPPPPDTGNPDNPGDVQLELVADGLTSPLGLVEPNDGSGRQFIYDQIGRVQVLNSNGVLSNTPFLDVANRMPQLGTFDERGLLGFAFHPNYAANGRCFVLYTAPKGETDPPAFDSRSRLSEFQVSADDPSVADPDSELILLEILQPQANHNAGQIAFGPDGFLYIASGDGGASNDVGIGHTPELGNAQDRTNLLGKILRIDVDGPPAPGLAYAIPEDNPFIDEPTFRAEIYAYGFRNPFRFSFDQADDQALFTGDVGQNLLEEVNIVNLGGNFGWNIKEGSNCFSTSQPSVPAATCPDIGTDGTPLVEPILTYPQVAADGQPIGISVIGGFVYRGNAIPELDGQYIFGDFSTSFSNADGTLFAATQNQDETWTRRELTVANNDNRRINKFVYGLGQDATGEVYIMTSDNSGPFGNTGSVYKLVPTN